MAQGLDSQVDSSNVNTRLTRRALLRLAARGGVGLLAANVVAAGVGVAVQAAPNQVPRGVRLAGIDVGGLRVADATVRFEAAVREYLRQTLAVRLSSGAGAWQVTPADLGAAFDITGSVGAALAVGRSGSWLADSMTRLGALVSGRVVPAQVSLDEARVVAYLETWAPGVTTWPVDAVLTTGKDGRLTVTPERLGQGLDVAGSTAAFTARVRKLSTDAVLLVQRPVGASITADMLRSVLKDAERLVSEPATLKLGTQTWSVTPDLLRPAMGYRRVGDALVVNLAPEPLEPVLAQVVGGVGDPGVNARVVLGQNGNFTIVPGKEGQALDRAATVVALSGALNAGQRTAEVVRRPAAPAIVAADLEPVRARAQALVSKPLTVSFDTYNRVFVRSDLAPLLAFVPQPGQTPPVRIAVNPERVRALSTVIANDLNQDVRDAEFKWVSGTVSDVVTSQDGRVVDLAGTDSALSKALLEQAGTVAPVVAVTPPKVASSQRTSMVVTDRLGYGRTDYSFSIPNRKWNVELSVQRLNGALVPPDGIFSFNQTVGEQTVNSGYKEAYGIALVGSGSGGAPQVKTVTSIGGGICQVSTTLFQGLFRAGLPVEERNWHSYWIPAYGQPPSGLQGLDATVDSEGKVDLKVRNSTGGWIAIEAVADGAEIRIAVYGKDPGWTVQIDTPVITNPRKADPKPKIEKTYTLPPGQSVVVEHAVDGFDAAIRRKVIDPAGKVLLDTTFTSSYAPSSNVTLLGVPPGEPLTNP